MTITQFGYIEASRQPPPFRACCRGLFCYPADFEYADPEARRRARYLNLRLFKATYCSYPIGENLEQARKYWEAAVLDTSKQITTFEGIFDWQLHNHCS